VAVKIGRFFPLLCIEVLRGVIVALELISEAIPSAFVAGVHSLTGLNAAFLVGLISDATGARVAVMVALVAQQGVEYLFVTLRILRIFAGRL
jgi:SulP family sulfate permease